MFDHKWCHNNLYYRKSLLLSNTSSLILAALMAVSIGALSGCKQENTSKSAYKTQAQTHDNATLPSQNATSQSALPNTSATGQCNNQAIANAYQTHNAQQKTQVLGCGQIIKVLKDDTEGSQHQKFLVKLDGYPQITVLIAHNIDLAQRVANISAHQPIQFYGEYIYNPKGGVVHWTHKDPAARHQDGWLDYQGQKYQ